MAKTIVEKILGNYSGNEVLPGQIVTIEPDRVMSHDNTAFIIKKFSQTGITKLWNNDKIVIIFDHCVPAETKAQRQNHQEAREFAKQNKLLNFFDDKAGVCHQVMMEEGFVLPGQIILGADSHSTLYGAVGALGIPINRTEMAGIWATGKIWLKVPETIRVDLQGNLPKGVYSKDIILKLLSILKADGATYKVLEFHGANSLSISSRMTLSNMSVELGAKAGIVCFDDVTKEYLKGKSNSDFTPIQPDKDAKYEKVISLNLSKLVPQISCPNNVDNVKPITNLKPIKIDQAYLGSCTNGRIEDLQIAADILKNTKIKNNVQLVVYPASTKIMNQAEKLGILTTLRNAGAIIKTASCGPCFGAVGSTLKKGQVCISSSNRNFCGRMGDKDSFVYLASPAVVAASCIAGEITDPRRFV